MTEKCIEFPDVSKSWYKNGKLYRKDGPAVEYPDGTEYWYKEGLLHREDGPAIELPDGSEAFYLKGLRCPYDVLVLVEETL